MVCGRGALGIGVCGTLFRSEKVREYFRWLNRMYNEGILDPEFATQTHEDYIAKIASGRVLALMDTDWDYSDGEKILIADGKLDPILAVTLQKLKVEGNIEKALKLKDILAKRSAK